MTIACQVSISLFREKRNGDRFDKLLAESHAKNYIRNLIHKYPEVSDDVFSNIDDDESLALDETLEYLGIIATA